SYLEMLMTACKKLLMNLKQFNSMENKKIIVSKKEVDLYKKLIENSYTVDPVEKKSHRKLYNELQTAFLFESSEMPPSVVRLNSIVTIQTSFGRKDGIQLVLPQEGDLGKRKLSIMSPMGCALI